MMKDWMIRALKTFVQAFFGVLIPAVVTMLQDGWPENWNKVWVLLAPTLAAALAAAISAVWNIILEKLKEEPPKPAEMVEGGIQHTPVVITEKPDYRQEVDDYLGKH